MTPLPPALPGTGLYFSWSFPEVSRALSLSVLQRALGASAAAGPLRASLSPPWREVLWSPLPTPFPRLLPPPCSGLSRPHPLHLLTACPALSRGTRSILRLTPQPGTARPGAEHPGGGGDLLLVPPSSPLPPPFLSLPPSPRPRVAPVMERASPSPSSAPSNAPSNRATSAPAGPIRAGNIWAPTSAGCGREVMRSSVAAGTRRSCHRRRQQHRRHLLQEQRGKDGAALPPSGAGARWVSDTARGQRAVGVPCQGGGVGLCWWDLLRRV